MANISACEIFDSEKVDKISTFIVDSQLKSGMTSSSQMIGDFWNTLTEQGINYESKLVWLANYMIILTRLVSISQIRKNDLTQYTKGFSHDQIVAISETLDSLDSLEEYIQSTFIDPFLPEVLNEKADLEIVKEEASNLVEDTDPDNSLENEEEVEEKERLEEDLEILLDEFGDNQESVTEEEIGIDFDNLNIINESEASQEILINRAIRQKYISIDHAGFFRTFIFNKDADQFTEVSSDVSRSDIGSEPMSREEFVQEYKGYPMVLNHIFRADLQAARENTFDALSARFKKVADRFWQEKILTLFGNSLTEKDRSNGSYFVIDEKGELIAGDLANVMNQKNKYLKKLFRQTEKGAVTIDQQILDSVFGGKENKLVLRKSEDPTLKLNQLVMAVQKNGKDVVVLGNFFDTQAIEVFQKTPNGAAYLNFVREQLSKSGTAGVDITNMGIVLENTFLPNFKSAEENRIYPTDQARYGENSDVALAQKLSLTQARTLYEAMGYTVSRPYIDKGVSGSNNTGGAFIAVSPFYGPSEIEQIIHDEFGSSNDIDFARINRKHNITFIHLSRKNLTFGDYMKLTKNNRTLRTFEEAGDENPLLFRDTEKIQAMFNFGQSAPIHYRLASSIEYMEEYYKQNPTEQLQSDILLLKAFLFADQDLYTSDALAIAKAIDWKETFLASVKAGKPKLFKSDLEKINQAYTDWKGMGTARDENGKLLQYQASKEIASRLFGYMPAKVNSALDRQIIDKKRRFAKSIANGDQVLEAQRLKKGGIYSNTVMEALHILRRPEIQAITIKGKSLEQAWNSDSVMEGGVEVSGELISPTFNPVVSNKNSKNSFKGHNISSMAELKDSYDGENLVEDYLEVEYMPQMPHLEIKAENLIPENPNNNPVRRQSGRLAAMKDTFKNKNKTVTEVDERNYDLPEGMVEGIYADLLGEIQGDLIFMESPIETAKGLIVGQVGKNVLKLHSYFGKISEKVLRHEIMHRVVNEILTPSSRRSLYSAAKKRMLDQNPDWVSTDQITDLQADEFLSENYERTFGSYRSDFLTKLPRIVQDFYYFLRRMYESFSGNRGLIELVAQQLESGYFVNAALNQDGYNGKFLNSIVKSAKELAMSVHPNIQRGTEITKSLIQSFVTNVQIGMFGEVATKDLENGWIEGAITFKEGIESYKEDLRNILWVSLNPNEENIGIESVHKLWGTVDFTGTDEEILLLNTKLDVLSSQYDQMTLDEQAVYDVTKSIVNFNDLAKHAFPFIKIGNEINKEAKTEEETPGIVTSEEANASGAEKQVEESISESNVNSDNETVSSTARHLFERSELSALGTMPEKVKFFLYNTKSNNDKNSRELVFRPHVDKYFELIFNSLTDSLTNVTGREFTIKDIQDAAKAELNKLKGAENSHVYRSVNGIYKRFLDPTLNSYSFFDIAQRRSDDPKKQEFYDQHQEILNAILSAQKSVIQQGFLQSTSRGFTHTKSDGHKEFKNSLKDGIINKLFAKISSDNSTQYQLSKTAIKTFFSNGTYRLSNAEGGIQLNIGTKGIVIKPEHFSKSVEHHELTNKFLLEAMDKFTSPTELFMFLKDLGMNMSRDFFNHYITEAQEEGDYKARKKKLLEIAIHSYLILAKQHTVENEANGQFDTGSMTIINLASSRRDELLSQVQNEALQADILGDDVSEKKAEKPVFSPSTLYLKFESIGKDSALVKYEKVPTLVYIMEGSKEVVDKYPTTMHRVIGKLKKTKAKNERLLEAFNENREVPVDMDTFLKITYPALYSNFYKNPLIDGQMDLGEPEYYKGTKDMKSNRSKGFLEMTTAEWTKELLTMMMGNGLSSEYDHLMEIQADRGQGITSKLGANQGSRYRHHPVLINGNWVPIDPKQLAIDHIRLIPFHHAQNIMKEVYGIFGMNEKVAEIQKLADQKLEGGIKNAFKELDVFLKEQYALNPMMINSLTKQKHFVMSGDTIAVAPLIKARMEHNRKSFEESVEQEYLNFAEMIYKTFSDPDLPQEARFHLDQKMVESVPQFQKLAKFTSPKSTDKKKYLMLFSDERKDLEKYSALDKNGKINSYHPALYSMFLTYFINQSHIAQRLTGDLYLYRPDKKTGPNIMHSYVTDNIKRQGTFTTPKIEAIHMERDATGRVINRKGLTTEVNIGYMPDQEFNSVVDSPEFNVLYSSANKENTARQEAANAIRLEKGLEPKLINFSQETTDGTMMMSDITMQQLQTSYGGDAGMNVGTLIKMNLHSFSPTTGNLNLPKSLAQVITADVLKNSTSHYLNMLKMMYRTAEIISPDGSKKTLWDIYEEAYNKDSFENANKLVSEIYFNARAGEKGYLMNGDIVHFMAYTSTNKGAQVGNNSYDENGNPIMDYTVFDKVDTTGLGIILDLQKDIHKADNEITLSSQMVFLLGINGENHQKSFKLYDLMREMSRKEMDKIIDTIAFQVGGKAGNNILKNKGAVKKWMIKEIKDSFTKKNDFGLIYQLVENFSDASISNPILMEEIFSKIGSVVSRAIVQKMNGFKAVQIPAHNLIFMYQDPATKRWMMKEDAVRKGIFSETLKKRNLSYSRVTASKKGLTDTDIFTGNIFTGKYGIDQNITLDEVFAMTIDGQEYSMEAVHFDRINSLESLNPLRVAIDNKGKIEWMQSPIIQALIKENAINPELVAKINKGNLTPQEQNSLFQLYKDRTVEMNRMIYGLMTRIPGTAKNSSSPTRIRGFVNGYKNVIFTPAEWFLISGSDNDGDTVQFWHYDKDKNNLNNAALNTSREILKDINNVMEIFSGIDLSFFTEKADIGKRKMVENGLGYFPGSLRTVVEIKDNNSTGAILTGTNATQSKIHSYATIGKSMVLDWASKITDQRRLGRLSKLFTSGQIQFSVETENGNEIINSGALYANKDRVYVDEKGDYIYKWNEMLTNASIDNAKHLVMNLTNLNQYNAGIQSALTFFGVGRENIIAILSHPNVKAVYDKVAVLDNIVNPYRGNAKKAIEALGGDEALQSIGIVSEINEDGIEETSTIGIIEYFKRKNFVIDFSDEKDVYGLITYMEKAAKEINEIRKVIKVSESVPGKSAKQEMMVENLLDSVNMGFSGNNKLVDAKSLLDFLNTVSPRDKFDHKSRTYSEVIVNPLMKERVMKSLEKSIFIHPLALLSTVPHLREFAIRHLEFQQMKEGHLLSDVVIKNTKNELMKYIDFKLLRSERNRNLINKSVYKFISGVFLEGYNNYHFEGKSFDLSSFSGKSEFRSFLKNHIDQLKMNTSNAFLDRLDVSASNIIYPGSEKLDSLGKVLPSEHFSLLPAKLKEAFLLYEATSNDTHFQYKKGSFVTFMDGETFNDYHEFLRKAELGGTIFRNNADVKSFVASFAFENPSMLKQVLNSSVESAGEEKKYGYIYHRNENEAKKLVLNFKEIRDFDLGNFNEQRLADVFKFQQEIEVFMEERIKIREEYDVLIESKDVLNNADKEKLNRISDRSDWLSDEIHKIEAKISSSLNRPIALQGQVMYRLVKGWNPIKKEPYNKLYRVRLNDKSGKYIMEQLLFKFDANVSKYSRISSIPEVLDATSIVKSYDELKSKIDSGALLDGTYYGENFEQYQVENKHISINKFAFAKGVPTPSVKRKAKAITAVIQKAFPAVKIEMVSGLTGEYADVAGFVHQNTVYLNADKMGLDVPMHEFSHIFIDLLEKTNPQLFAKIEAMVTKSALMDSVSKKYEKFGNTQKDNVKEVFATMLGNHFKNEYSESMEGFTSKEKKEFPGLVDIFITWVQDKIREILTSLGIRKQYINDQIISEINLGTNLNTIFNILGTAVVQGKVITDLSTSELNELEKSGSKKKKATDAEVQKIIDQMMIKGQIKTYC